MSLLNTKSIQDWMWEHVGGMGTAQIDPQRLPQAIDEHASKAGLRTVAIFEAAKGLLGLALAVILISVRNHVEDIAEELLYHLHIAFDQKLAQAVLHGAADLSDLRVWTVLAVALSYAAVRFTEAWGLWHCRVWAEWFALLSGALYLPIEIQKVFEHRNWLSVAVLAVNLAIIFYMLEIRIRESRLRKKPG